MERRILGSMKNFSGQFIVAILFVGAGTSRSRSPCVGDPVDFVIKSCGQPFLYHSKKAFPSPGLDPDEMPGGRFPFTSNLHVTQSALARVQKSKTCAVT